MSCPHLGLIKCDLGKRNHNVIWLKASQGGMIDGFLLCIWDLVSCSNIVGCFFFTTRVQKESSTTICKQ